MKRLICPKCKVPIDAAGIGDATATCQQCHSKFRVKPKSTNAPPPPPQITAPTDSAQDAVPPSPSSAPVPVASTQFVPSIDVGDSGQEVEASLALKRVLPILAAAGLVVGCFIVAAFIFWPAGDDPPQLEQPMAATGTQAPTQQNESQETPAGNDGGLLDLSDLMEFEATAPAETVRKSPTNRSQSSDGVFDWSKDVKLISIPSGSVVTVDGVAQAWLSDSEFADMSVQIPSPPGAHVISLSSSGSPTVTKSGGFPAYYSQQQKKYRSVEGLDFAKLTKAAVAANGIFRDPILPHMFGNYYWQRGETGAAERFWKLAIQVSPVFAPAHLNLAYAAGERGDLRVAGHELMLASYMNIQDAFGISNHAAELQQSLATMPTTGVFSARDYWIAADLPLQRIEVINVLLAMRDLAPSPADKVACLNNIGVYLMHAADAPGPAVGFFQQSQLALADVQPGKTDELSKTVLNNLVKAAESARFVEVDLFRKLASRSGGTSR